MEKDRGGENVRIRFAHKIGLGLLTGLVMFAVFFTAMYGLVISVNAIAAQAQAEAIPFTPAWAFPMITGFIGFLIPIAGIISQDFEERTGEEKA